MFLSAGQVPTPFRPYVGGLSFILAHYSFYLGPFFVIGILPAELAPQASRAITGGALWASAWLFSIFVGMVYPPLLLLIGSYAILPMTFGGVVSFWFLWAKLPETKGRSADEIARDCKWKENGGDADDGDDVALEVDRFQ